MTTIEILYKINGEIYHSYKKDFDLLKVNERYGRFRNWLNKGKNEFCKKLSKDINIQL